MIKKLSSLHRFVDTGLVLLGTLLCLPAFATERYVIDSLHTYSSFEYQHWGLSAQRGRFDRNSGVIEIDRDNKVGMIELEIDAGSVNTGSALFDSVMRSTSFFDVDHFQKIIFNSSQFLFDGDQLTQIQGTLTIKDTTLPVTLDVTQFNCRFMILYFKKACGANGFTRILRSDYKMDKYTPFVSDEVTLYFSVEAIKE